MNVKKVVFIVISMVVAAHGLPYHHQEFEHHQQQQQHHQPIVEFKTIHVPQHHAPIEHHQHQEYHHEVQEQPSHGYLLKAAPVEHHYQHHEQPLIVKAPVAILKHHQEEHHHEEEHHAPMNYAFEYAVHDPHTGDIKEHKETREGHVVKGYYTLKEADGTKRIVHYTADKHSGFNAVVTHEGKPHENQHSESSSSHHHQKYVIPVVQHKIAVPVFTKHEESHGYQSYGGSESSGGHHGGHATSYIYNSLPQDKHHGGYSQDHSKQAGVSAHITHLVPQHHHQHH